MIQSIIMDKYLLVYNALLSLYGEPSWRQPLSPVDELVNTILSQNTNDANRDVAFDRLGARFASWEAVRDAPTAEVVEAIRPAGLAPQKGPRIQNALRTISQQQGIMSLDFLAELPLEEARRWLLALPGVGPKTAAIVLLFSFGRPAFPVDTHVHRVTRRLGLTPLNMSAERAHPHLEQVAPPEHFFSLHLNLIRHGRQVCRARNPKCQSCRLQEYCNHYQTLQPPEKN